MEQELSNCPSAEGTFLSSTFPNTHSLWAMLFQTEKCQIYCYFYCKNKMSYTNRHIVETYSGLFEGLNSLSKIELIESLSKSLKKEKTTKDNKFYKSFGAFSSDKSAEEIIDDIKSSRSFRDKEISF
jgi:hypothetical protein